MRITKRQLKRIIREALTGPPQNVEEWMYWGGEYGLSAEEDNDGQTIFYLSRNHPDSAKIAAEAMKNGASVDTDNDGNDVIYTGMTPRGPLGESLLRRTIREEAAKSTEKYDDDSALTGDQDELPDELQKGIIDKTVEDREEEKIEEILRLVREAGEWDTN